MHKGFTLIEILLVVIILSILIGFSLPLLKNTYQNLQLYNFARDLQSHMNYLSQQAIVSGETINLTINSDKKQYWSAVENDNTRLKTAAVPGDLEIETEQDKILFYPDGSIDSVTLKLSNKNNQSISLTTKGVLGSVKMQTRE